MDILISVAAKVSEYTVAPIGRQLGYLFFYKRIIADLNTQIDGLKNVKQRIQHKVDEAQNNARGIEPDVNDWLAQANQIITEDHGKFTRQEEQANTKCIWGTKFPNLVLRHQLSRRAKKMAETVATQIQKGENINEVSYRLNLPISVGNKGYEEFESRNRTLTKVMEAVRDPNVGMVGVWGMGGVGKTMLAKEVARRARDEEKLFTEVVFTTISKEQNIKMIQQDIGEKLGMTFSEESKDVRAERLRSRLRQENNILIILDDIWGKLDLEDVGISFGGINQKGCKILLTTRYYRVLASDMSVDRNVIFEVGVLLEHEAMSLFRKIVGDQSDKQELQGLASKIVKECGGLPIAITTVASALKVEPYGGWKNALQELRKSNPINIDGMHEKVYTSIKLSYDYIKSVEAKHLLLLCSLFPEDAQIRIRVLCDYGFGLNLFGDVNTLEEARNKTDALVTKLKDHSLLLNADGTDRVKLHDVIQDVVICIASKLDDHHRMHNIRNADELEKYFNKEMFKDSTAISLYGIKANQYPQTLKGPELNLLRLVPNYGRDFEELPHQFFEGLDKLLVLDCELTSLKLLPAASSFCLLPNLQTLRLTGGCILGDISWIGELKSLKILDLSFNNSITELPREIGKLNRLLSLNLQGCRFLTVIEPNIISSLTRLEELNLKDSFTNWEVEGVANVGDERRNANLNELKELRRLIDLKLEVPNINSLAKDIFSENLEMYNITIGCNGTEIVTSRRLRLKLCPNNVLNEHDFAALLGRSDTLYLSGLKIAKSIAFEIDRMGFQHLKHLTVEESSEIRCIVNSNNGNMDCPPAAFPSLESLVLWRLMNLENIIHEKLTKETSFEKLRVIEVSNCDKLKSLFSLFNIPRQLEGIKVSDCTMMEEIISHDSREGDHAQMIQEKLTTETSFGKLRRIKVSNCDKLKSLFPLSNIVRQLEWIEVRDCTMMEEIISHDGREGDHVEKMEISQLWDLRLIGLPKVVQFIATSKSDEIKREGQQSIDAPLFNEQVVFPKLDKLHIDSLNIRKIWNDDQLQLSRLGFQSLTRIDVVQCDHLTGIIPSCMTASLVHLRNLKVSSCKAMKEIVFIDESAEVMGIYVSFPKLKYLELHDLPNLKRFCAGDISFPKLNSLELDDLPNLERFCAGDISLPIVKSLELYGLPNLERFCGGDISLPKLESLELDGLPNLKRFCGGDFVDCPSLSKLAIRGCQKLKAFITNTMPTTTTEKEDENSTGSVADKHLSHHKDVVKVDQLRTESSCSKITCQPHPLCSVEEHDEYLVVKIKSLSELRLWNFPNQQQLPKKFQTVELLSIAEWGIRLKDLATPLMSFQNLKVLTVNDCHDLISLFSPSTAKILSQRLTKLAIIGCKSLRQVIANDDDDNINIIFSQLKFLVLYDLSNLTSFYSRNNVVLQFPRLAQLLVGCCPEMKTFCHGNIHCPSLHYIILGKWPQIRDLLWNYEVYDDMYFCGDPFWKSDINTTIQKLWEDKKIRDSPEGSLEMVRHTFGDSCWKGDINTTIQKLWEDKKIRDSPETEESVENVDNAEEDEAVGP